MARPLMKPKEQNLKTFQKLKKLFDDVCVQF